MPSAPSSSAIFAKALPVATLRPALAMTGSLPSTTFTARRTISRNSSWDRLKNSPVPPATNTAEISWLMNHSRRCR